MLRIDQFHPSFSYGDAIGNNLLSIRDSLRDLGYKSEIFALNIHEKLVTEGKNCNKLKNLLKKDDVLLVHYSIWSDIYPEIFELPCQKVFVYHNITPPHFLEKFNSSLAEYAKIGIDKLAEIKDYFFLSLADSEFNKKELEMIGFKNVNVLPITIDFNKFNIKAKIDYFNDSKTNILFVGRIAPNKKQEDLIKTFYYYKNFINNNSRLILAGNYSGMENYKEYLELLIAKLNLKDDVIFTGHTTFEELVSIFKSADLFLCMSEHEGFCVPLVEAMYLGIPVLAYNSSAISYTMDDAGVIFNSKDFKLVAELMDYIISNEEFKSNLIDRQKSRALYFSKKNLVKYIDPYITRINDYVLKHKSLKSNQEQLNSKRISIISSSAQDGIHEYAKNLMNGFIKNGHVVHYIGVDNRNFNDLKEKIVQAYDSEIVIIEHEEGIFNASDLVWSMKKLKKRHINIVFSPHELELNKFSDYKNLNSIAMKRFTQDMNLFKYFSSDILKSVYYLFKLKNNLFKLGKLSDRIVVHSKKQERLINTIYTVNKEVVHAPLPAQNLEGDKVFYRKKLNLPINKFIYIMPGFIFRRKRIIEVIKSAPSDCLLVISGTESEYDPGYLDQIKEAIKEFNYKNVIINNDYELMEEFLLASDCVVLYYSDIFQSAVASLAVGAEKPCIFSNIEGFQFYEGVGLFVNNETELRTAMEKLKNDTELYEVLLNNVYMFKEQLQPERISELYINGLGED